MDSSSSNLAFHGEGREAAMVAERRRTSQSTGPLARIRSPRPVTAAFGRLYSSEARADGWLLVNFDPAEISRLANRTLEHVREVLERDPQALVDTLTQDDDPVLGTLLRFHLLAEQILDRLFLSSLRRAQQLEDARLSFSQKLNLASALGVVADNAVEGMRRVNTLRNRCAHVHAHRITAADIDRIGESIGSAYQDQKETYSRHLRLLAVFTLSKIYEPFLAATLMAEAIARVKAEEGAE